ncbi:hypothetical protein KIN20_015972 [Parelaphostrongylus tenuis]|uniref:Ubiquitin-like domain-containing protein n=1 Tax=Parelaphostrongylus tenuis TaxID=148309 RepID=A0AAD5MJB5_PARTN|nr:hypothetical protein KIN20_015972 [Parelaphostrongylus tenuis]
MKLNIKNRSDGSVFQVEVAPNETIGELRSRVYSKLGNSNDKEAIRISLGAEELKFADSVLIKDVGLVSGDQLFIEAYSSTSSSKPADPRRDDFVKDGTSKDEQKPAMMITDEKPRHGPLFPAPDPLQPIPNPMIPPSQPPRVNPFGPEGAPFGGQGGPPGGRNPLDPFDPSNREIFPSRPDQGVPRGEPRYFPANQWDRKDFI